MVLAMSGLASACTLEPAVIEHPLLDSLASALHPGLVADAREAPAWVNIDWHDGRMALFANDPWPKVDVIAVSEGSTK